DQQLLEDAEVEKVFHDPLLNRPNGLVVIDCPESVKRDARTVLVLRGKRAFLEKSPPLVCGRIRQRWAFATPVRPRGRWRPGEVGLSHGQQAAPSDV